MMKYTLLEKDNVLIPGDQFAYVTTHTSIPKWRVICASIRGEKVSNYPYSIFRRKDVGNHIRGKGKPIHIWIDERLGTVQPWGQGFGSSLTDNQASFIKIAKKHEFRLNKLESFIEKAMLAGYSVHISKG